jgi:hypothetical protein
MAGNKRKRALSRGPEVESSHAPTKQQTTNNYNSLHDVDVITRSMGQPKARSEFQGTGLHHSGSVRISTSQYTFKFKQLGNDFIQAGKMQKTWGDVPARIRKYTKRVGRPASQYIYKSKQLGDGSSKVSYEEAEKMFRQVLKVTRKELRGQHPDTLASLKNLEIVLRDQGKHEKDDQASLESPAMQGQVW